MAHLSYTYPSAGAERISPSSLLPEHFHHPHILELQKMPVNWDIADYCIHYIIGILAPYRRDTETHRLKSVFFSHVAANVLSRPEVGMTTILVALCFISRISWGFQHQLNLEMEKPWDGEDLLLGALIAANKSLNDSVWSLKSWTEWTKVLGSKTLQRAERNFLRFIDYNISISETELLAHYDGVMEYCVRKRGGWYNLMDIGDQNPSPQPAVSPKAYPAPIGSGRPRAATPQQHRVLPVAQQEESNPEYYPQPPHPLDHAPTQPLPSSSALWRPEVAPLQSSYPKRDRQRSRSPSPRYSCVSRTVTRDARTWERSPQFAYDYSASYRGEARDRYARNDCRARYPRECGPDRFHASHTRRAHRRSSRAPYDGEERHRHTRGRGSPGERMTPLRGLSDLHDLPDDRRRHPRALLFATYEGYEDPYPRPMQPPLGAYYWHSGRYQR